MILILNYISVEEIEHLKQKINDTFADNDFLKKKFDLLQKCFNECEAKNVELNAENEVLKSMQTPEQHSFNNAFQDQISDLENRLKQRSRFFGLI